MLQPQLFVKVLLPLIICMLRLLHMTHSVDATQLQRRVADEDGQELPTHTRVLNQLQHRVAANALLGSFLLQHLLHLCAVVLVAPQLPQSCGGEWWRVRLMRWQCRPQARVCVCWDLSRRPAGLLCPAAGIWGILAGMEVWRAGVTPQNRWIRAARATSPEYQGTHCRGDIFLTIVQPALEPPLKPVILCLCTFYTASISVSFLSASGLFVLWDQRWRFG